MGKIYRWSINKWKDHSHKGNIHLKHLRYYFIPPQMVETKNTTGQTFPKQLSCHFGRLHSNIGFKSQLHSLFQHPANANPRMQHVLLTWLGPVHPCAWFSCALALAPAGGHCGYLSEPVSGSRIRLSPSPLAPLPIQINKIITETTKKKWQISMKMWRS